MKKAKKAAVRKMADKLGESMQRSESGVAEAMEQASISRQIGARHKQARTEVLKMTVTDYCKRFAVASASVYAWENGTRSIPVEVMRELETRYRISTSWLCNGTEPMLLASTELGQAEDISQALRQMLGNSAAITLEQLQSLNDYVQRAGKNLSSLSREVFSIDHNKARTTRFPLMTSSVSAGSPVSTSDDTVSVDIVEFLVNNPEHTFFVNVVGDSMKDIGIYDSDTLIIDRSIVPKSGEIIVARVFNELTVKRFVRNGKRVILAAENKAHKNIEVTEDMDFSIIGVVTTSIKKFRPH